MGLSRQEFYNRIGLMREIEPMTEQAYAFVQAKERSKVNRGAAHSHDWHISFHGSSFPGDNPYACGRAALYSMMDLPQPLPGRWLQQVADAGKDIEDRLVMTWYQSGQLISTPPFPGMKQMQFEDPETWLTSTVDAITLHTTSDQSVVCEVKSKFAHDLEDMRKLARGPDTTHVRQLKCQIGFAHEAGDKTVVRCINTGRLGILRNYLDPQSLRVCPEHGGTKCLRKEVIKAPDYGYIYYVSRDSPSDTFEFYFDYDPDFMAAGRAKLKQWRQSWLDGTLPQTDFSDKRFSHPFGWQWSKDQYPCHWCKFGAVCREDHREAVSKKAPIALSDSAGILSAKEVREEYDLEVVRKAVEDRWAVAASQEDLV